MRRARTSLSSALNLAMLGGGVARGGDALHGEEDEDRARLELRRRSELLASAFIFRIAVLSRILVAAVSVFSVPFVTPYDSSTLLMLGNLPSPLQCASNWDGAWFTKLAESGYVYEQSHAFFPLMPWLMRLTSNTLLFWLRPLLDTDAALYSLSGAIISNALLIWSSVILFRLGQAVLKDSGLAMRAALLFCFNPASVFFSVSMTESLFAFLSFSGMLLLEMDPVRPSFSSRLNATILFALATMTRSNGVLLGMHSLWAAYRAYQTDVQEGRLRRAVLELAAVGCIHLCGLILVLGFGWVRFCMNRELRQPWCEDLLPNVYSYVQDFYWNVGPFRYYTWKQAPNFLLAAPAFLLGIGGVITTATRAPVYALHLFVSLLIAVVIMHVQVITRFVCAAVPAFYWHAARITLRRSGSSYLVLLYFGFYLTFGTAMFCNFFPWT